MKTTYKIMLALVIVLVLAVAYMALVQMPQSADTAQQALEAMGY